jgi:tRNA (guanine37-N1)-methyltransferase
MKLTFDSKLKGMTELNRGLFDMTVSIPAIKVRKNDYNAVKRALKNSILESLVSMRKFQELSQSDPLYDTHKFILLDPDMFKLESIGDDVRKELAEILKIDAGDDQETQLKSKIEQIELKLGYEDLKFDEVIRAIIPDEILNENVSVKSYSIIGHIAHFNLRDVVLTYKNVIGMIYLFIFSKPQYNADI